MKTLAVTGGIGSGKSTVCAVFARRGVPVYDSDSRTKALYDEDSALADAVEDAMGEPLKDSSGKIDRKRLASIVFSDRSRLSLLESIVHPRVLEDFLRWRSMQEAALGEGSQVWNNDAGPVPFVIIESAIILEKPIFRNVADKVLMVDAPSDVRLMRIVSRDNMSASAAKQRMSSQGGMSILSSMHLPEGVDFMIENDAGVHSLEKQVDDICRVLWL